MDLRDPLARWIVEQLGGAERSAPMVAGMSEREEIPIALLGLPARLACRLTQDDLPGLEAALGSIEAGAGPVVVAVSQGGAAIMVIPQLLA